MASVTSIDNLTAQVIKRALASTAGGDVRAACAIAEQGLAQGADVAALNALLGTLKQRAGDFDGAARHLRIAHEVRPRDPIIATNLTNTLVQLGRSTEALALLSDELVDVDPTGQLLKLRAFLLLTSEDFEKAIASYERIVAVDPTDPEVWNNLGNAYQSAGRLDEAIGALQRAAALDPHSAPIRLNLATALVASGAWGEAEDALRAMAADFPGDAKPLRELHALLKEQGRDAEALEAVEEAVRRDPTNIELLIGQASHLSAMLKGHLAESVYHRVLELDPDNAYAHLGLAVCFDLTNRAAELSALVRRAEEKGIGANSLNFIKAYDHRRAKRFAEGLAALTQVPDDLETPRRAHLMGQLLEGAGLYDEAFGSFKQMNELMSKEMLIPEELGAPYRNIIRKRMAATTADWAGRWRRTQIEDERPTPVFLVGFPRSGTTLLDTMLMGHPLIEVLEEEPTLHRAFEVFQDYESIPLATDEQVRTARDGYFATAGALTPLRSGSLLVDKNPLTMNALPFVRRIFPDARIILALRHPLDVILSCYVTNFRLNDGMASFVRLDSAAELYDLSFSYFERVQELIPTPTHSVVYENVVSNGDQELRRLFDFLRLDWHDAVLDHQSTALSRGRIKTASYAQVVEPIYQRSAGRWRNYRKHLEPVLPVLRPWAEKFGYEV